MKFASFALTGLVVFASLAYINKSVSIETKYNCSSEYFVKFNGGLAKQNRSDDVEQKYIDHLNEGDSYNHGIVSLKRKINSEYFIQVKSNDEMYSDVTIVCKVLAK